MLSTAARTAGRSTLQVAEIPDGPPIALTACDGNCLGATTITEPLLFTTGSVSSPPRRTGFPLHRRNAEHYVQSVYSSAADPFQLDTIYYIVNPSGTSFGLAATPGGPAIAANNAGLGPSNIANANLPHHWAFRGLELVEAPGRLIYNLLLFGSGNETSVQGMVHHMEVDHCWLHDNPIDQSGPNQVFAVAGARIFVHVLSPVCDTAKPRRSRAGAVR